MPYVFSSQSTLKDFYRKGLLHEIPEDEFTRIYELPGYTITGWCDRGAYGQVWMVRDAGGKQLAMKIVKRREDREVEYNGLLLYRKRIGDHPNLIKIYDVMEIGDFIYYTMEPADNRCPGSTYKPDTLDWHSAIMSPQDIIVMALQLLDGIETIHKAQLVHRDIKPSNIIFVKGVPKIADIGLIDKVKTNYHDLFNDDDYFAVTTRYMLLGTQWFIPPEEFANDNENKYSVDLYALGKVIYCCLTRESARSYPSVPVSIINDPDYAKLNKIVNKLCDKDRSARITSINMLRKLLKE